MQYENKRQKPAFDLKINHSWMNTLREKESIKLANMDYVTSS